MDRRIWIRIKTYKFWNTLLFQNLQLPVAKKSKPAAVPSASSAASDVFVEVCFESVINTRFQTPTFVRLMTNFCVKRTIIRSIFYQIIFFTCGYRTKLGCAIFSPIPFVSVVGSGIEDGFESRYGVSKTPWIRNSNLWRLRF